MYGGRKRCIVDDKGNIVAFHGDLNYTEDGSKGQVMVYQPKFYYMRVPIETSQTVFGTAINKEDILISAQQESGFSIHPLFLDEDGNELEYVLIPAYEGSAYRTNSKTYVLNDAQDINFETDYLSSIIGAKPISGATQELTLDNAEKLARNRGKGWQLTNLKFESANQMLMMIEYGTLNLQNVFDKGITELTNQTGINYASITGSTTELGSTSGRATSTENEVEGNRTTYYEEGLCAISYRGLENPYGNISRFVGGIKVEGNGESNGGYITIDNRRLAFAIPNRSNWISSFGYDATDNWAMIPITISNGANSNVPVGDYCHISSTLKGTNCCIAGGRGSSKENAGIFYYGMDSDINAHAYSYSARIMFIPTIGSIHDDNYLKWLDHFGG